MSEPLLELLLIAAVVVVLMVYIETTAAGSRPGLRGMPSVVIGLLLVAVGGLLAAIEPLAEVDAPPGLQTPEVRSFVRDFVCFFGGLMFLGGGVVVRFSRRSTPRQMARRHHREIASERDAVAAQELLNSVVRSSISGVMILSSIRDDSGNVVDFETRLINAEAEQILGISATALVGQQLLERVPCIGTEGLFEEGVSVVETSLPFRDERSHTQAGRKRWYQILAVRHGDGLVVSFADVSSRKRTEEQLRHAAMHDTLTGLPSRSLLTDRLQQAINRAKRLSQYRFAVLFLDFDRFKIINDSLGHDVGDQLLIEISRRLRANLRDLDTPIRTGGGHLPARLGGDEFIVLLDGINGARDALIVAGRLQEALSAPYEVGGHEVATTASIGIVTSDGDYDRPDDILRDADTAMYEAKNSGKARHVVFDERMHNEVLERLHLERELRAAAERQHFRLAYQPIVSLESAALIGFEALIRWPHAQRGIVYPGEFISVAEELGLIVPIGEWVLWEAARTLACWQERCPARSLAMSVNLSKHQLASPNLPETVRAVLDETQIDPAMLILELTESTIMGDLEHLEPVLAGLRSAGVRLAMDDFGTGYSSLSILHRVPMDILKIDRSFITAQDRGRDRGAIIHTVVQLAHNLCMEVTAEGIETVDQLVLVQSLDCNHGQGYLFSRPLAPEDAEAMLDDQHRFIVAA